MLFDGLTLRDHIAIYRSVHGLDGSPSNSNNRSTAENNNTSSGNHNVEKKTDEPKIVKRQFNPIGINNRKHSENIVEDNGKPTNNGRPYTIIPPNKHSEKNPESNVSKAEKEFPYEAVNSEKKITAETVVDENTTTEAAMSSGGTNPNGYMFDLDLFKNLDKDDNNMYADRFESQNAVPVPQGVNHNPAAALLYGMQQQPRGMMHKVDEPKQPPKPQLPRNKPESVATSNINLVQKVDYNQKKVEFEVEPAKDAKATLVSAFPKNKEVFKNFPYLKNIEDIALVNGYQVYFNIVNTGIIYVSVYNSDGSKQISEKGFAIDTGHIYDTRIKIFPGIKKFYEGSNAYHLFKDPKRGIMNNDIIRDIIVGGNMAVNAKPMYTDEFIRLNRYVDMVSTPTNISREDRNYIHTRLCSVVNTIADILFKNNKDARFRIVSYDKSDKTIKLSTMQVPKNYGGMVYIGTNVCIDLVITDKNLEMITSNMVNTK